MKKIFEKMDELYRQIEELETQACKKIADEVYEIIRDDKEITEEDEHYEQMVDMIHNNESFQDLISICELSGNKEVDDVLFEEVWNMVHKKIIRGVDA